MGGSLALAADLSDSSASSSVSTVESEADESAESSIPPVEVEAEDSSADGSTEAPQPGKDDEVAASKDDDVGSDVSASAVVTSLTSAPRRMLTLQSNALGDPEPDDDGEEADVDPNVDDGSGDSGQAEDVAQTENEDLTTQSEGNNDAVATANLESEMAGIQVSYSADATSSFNAGSLNPGQVWVDKSVSKTNTTETSFSETLSIYGNKYTTESEYSTGNYVLVLDTTRSLYNADHSGKLVKAVTKATNDIVVEICKNPHASDTKPTE